MNAEAKARPLHTARVDLRVRRSQCRCHGANLKALISSISLATPSIADTLKGSYRPIADGSRRGGRRQCRASQARRTTTRNQCLYPLELITEPSDHRANFLETGDE